MDPCFEIEDTQLWQEYAPQKKTEEKAFTQIGSKLSQLDQDSRKIQWERDTLSLARDAATLGQLFQAESKSDRARKSNRLLHVKAQNRLGANLVSAFPEKNAIFRAGNQGQLEGELDKAGRTM